MSTAITVRNLEPNLVSQLRLRAARNGRSTEAEVRALIADALRNEPREDFWTVAERLRDLTAGRFQTSADVLLSDVRDQR